MPMVKVFLLIFITALITACGSAPVIHQLTDAGTLAQVEAELAAGADPNLPHSGYYPLQNAIYYHPHDEHQIPIIKALINAGAYVDGPSWASWTPLHYAVWDCQPAVIDILLDAGAHIDVHAGYDESTPLYNAVEYEKVACVNKLIDRGANLYTSQINGTSILQEAATKGEIDGNALVARYEQVQAQLSEQREEQKQLEAVAVQQAEQDAFQDRLETVWTRDSSLPPEIRRDKYLVAFSNSMKNGKYVEADFYAQLLERNQIGLEDSLYYFWGDALLRIGQPEAALEKLNYYLRSAGSSGQYYSRALSLIIEAEGT